MRSTYLHSKNIWRDLTIVLTAWVMFVGLPSLPSVRALLMAPLYVHDAQASGEIAYVMAGGDAYWERLRAASDLYHMRRIESLYILNEKASANYDFQTDRSQTKVEAAMAYLQFLGVPRNAIYRVEETHSAWLGSLSEAQALSHELSDHVERVVVVTSAPHTRRSLLCFTRSLPSGVTATAYAASPPSTSAELYSPLCHEYLKLFIYFLSA